MSFEPTYPHHLTHLPPVKVIKNEDFHEILLKARVELAELKGACGNIPNPLLLMSPAIIRESVASSNIENINTTLEEALQGQLFPEAEQRAPDKEVLRYRKALSWGFENITQYALSTRVILGIQSRLQPDGNGEYRRVQNQIVNSATQEVLDTPPIASDIPDLISNWEHYVNDRDNILDPLVKAAIAHYQFESIHPFTDGNGRTGRILMVLQLVYDGLLSIPVLYISGYINQNRSEYYRLLRVVTQTEEWHEYISFMLKGFYLQAKETKEDLQKIISYFNDVKLLLKQKHMKIYSADLVEALFTYPVITPTKLASVLNMHRDTASKHLKELAKAGILSEAKIGKYHYFANKPLMNILVK